MASSPKLVRLPDHGSLLCSADLRGNLRDFLQIVARFEALGPTGHLLLLGDVVHGPYLGAGPADRPAGVGADCRPWRDESPALLLKLSLLQERWPGRVWALLGDHEHAHVGGPHTSRFAADEVLALERRLGPDAAVWLRDWLRTWPLLAMTRSGLMFSHRAPAADLRSLDELELIRYGAYALPPDEGAGVKVQPPLREGERGAKLLAAMLWAQPLAPERARRVLAAVGAKVAVYGHEVVNGHEAVGQEQVILTSSFGVPDQKKRVLLVDLAGTYRSAADLKEGAEILPLYD